MTFAVTSVRGIAVRIHVSALVAFACLLLLLASAYFPSLLPKERDLTYWSVGFLATLSLFLSTLAHELGHSLVARARGVPVESITLVLFGGSSDIRQDREKPIDETLIAVSGPGVSLVIALVAAAARFGLPNPSQPLLLFLETVLLLNIWLGLFNLLPTLPLDGGRALRGLLWHWAGDYRRATHVASWVGRSLAGLLLFAGLALLLVSLDVDRSPIKSVAGYDPRMVAAAAILVAWLLNNGARSTYRQAVLQSRVAGITVEEIMTPDPPSVQPWTSLEDIVSQHFLQRSDRAVAVLRGDGVLVGLVAYSDVQRVPQAEWGSRAAGEIMTPVANLVTVEPTDQVEAAIRHMAQGHFNQVPVVADGRLVGMVARINVLRFLDLKNTTAAER